MTDLESLRAELERIEKEAADVANRRRHVELAIADLEGDTLKAAWLWAVINGTHEEGHKAWVRMMAASKGTEAYLSTEERDRDAIRAAMKEVKP